MEENPRSDNLLYKLTLGRPILWFPIICFIFFVSVNSFLGHISDFQLSQTLVALIILILFPLTWIYFIRYDLSAKSANNFAKISAGVLFLVLSASTIMENAAVVPLLKVERAFHAPDGWEKMPPRGEIPYPTSEIKEYGKGILGCVSKSVFSNSKRICPKVESRWEHVAGGQLTVDDLKTIASANGYHNFEISDKCGNPADKMENCSLAGTVDGVNVSLSYYSYGGITQDFTLTLTK